MTIYRSNEYPIDDPRCAFTELFTSTPGGRGADSLCMPTDVSNQVYIVGLTASNSEDWAELYLVDFDQRRFVPQKARHFYASGGNIHFRWGAGLTIVSPTTFELYCTKRHVLNMQVNTFGS